MEAAERSSQVDYSSLGVKQELFCKLYVQGETMGNGVHAYSVAYNVDITNQRGYNVAKSNAHRLLTNADILKRISNLLEEEGLNNAHVDKQLYLLITQNADFSAKIAAIREYNRIKNRTNHRVEAPTIDAFRLYIPAKRKSSYESEDSPKNAVGSTPSPVANL